MVKTNKAYLVLNMQTRGYLWAKAKRSELIILNGFCCSFCHSLKNLQFAHIYPTKLSGCGRGFINRVVDILANPDSYILICDICHKKLDKELASDKDGKDYWF